MLAALTASAFDLAVVGGGITGCCIARDAARRGLRVALIERADFSGGTSAATSRLIHGGLRYLRQLQVGVVRESLRERRIWMSTAPDAVRAAPFLLPTFGFVNDAWMRLALRTYDSLAWDRNRGMASGRQIPASQHLTVAELATREPVLGSTRASGGIVYTDAVSDSPERLAIACLDDAVAHGAVVANYLEATGLVSGDPQRVAVHDSRSGGTMDVRASVVVSAAGPWSDQVGARLGLAHPPAITRSKGIHIITKPLTGHHALLLPVRGRHLFVIPWRDHSLIGTTDTPWTRDPDAVDVTHEEVLQLVALVTEALPGVQLSSADVSWAYAGLRPLVTSSGSTYTASRRAEVRQVAPGILAALGGKWTTSRATAALAVDLAARQLQRTFRPCDTDLAPLPWRVAAAPGPQGDAVEIARVMHEEMAVTLEDVLFRRSHLGILGDTSADPATRRAQLAGWAALAGAVAGWDTSRQAAEVEQVIASCRRVSMWPA